MNGPMELPGPSPFGEGPFLFFVRSSRRLFEIVLITESLDGR
jgi:hypothetical protein